MKRWTGHKHQTLAYTLLHFIFLQFGVNKKEVISDLRAKEGERQAPAPAVLAPRRPDPCAFSAVVITGWFPEAEGVLA